MLDHAGKDGKPFLGPPSLTFGYATGLTHLPALAAMGQGYGTIWVHGAEVGATVDARGMDHLRAPDRTWRPLAAG